MPTQTKKIKYSIIFPTYDPKKLTDGFAERNKELLLRTIEGRDDVEFIEIKDVAGYPSAVNQGLRKAVGDYIFLINSDVIIEYQGWIEEMANPNVITTYKDVVFPATGESTPHFALVCIPRNIYKAVGDLDEQFDECAGHDDIDFFWRARELGYGFRSLREEGLHHFKVKHVGGGTFRCYFTPEELNAQRMLGVQRLTEKWKHKIPALNKEPIQGWNSDSPIFKTLIDEVNPKTIIEVGSWHGASALHMRSLTDAQIYCVDIWADDSTFEEFKNNIKNKDINFVRMHSDDARGEVPNAELIYIDGDHSYDQVYKDLLNYHSKLNPGGVLFGDDYYEYPGVAQAVNEFANRHNLKLEVYEQNFYILR